MRRLAFTVAITAALALPLAAQAPPRPSPAATPLVISGRILDDETGTPLRNARVAIDSTAPGASVVLSDADGRFSLTTTTTRSSVVVTKAGYAPGELKATESGAIDIRLKRGAAIEGRVLDEFGQPAASTRVAVRAAAGSRATRSTDADDRGEFRVGGLSAGTYEVAVLRPAPGVQPGFVDSGARSITVGAGDTASNVDFTVRADRITDHVRGGSVILAQGAYVGGVARIEPRVPPRAATRPLTGTSVVRGIVMTTDGRALPHISVGLSNAPVGVSLVREAMTGADGQFEFGGLGAGTYQVLAMPGWFQRAATIPNQKVTVTEAGVADVDLRIEAYSGVIEGYVADEDGEPVQGITVQALQVRYERGARRLAPAWSSRVTDDRGHYRLFGLSAGSYAVTAGAGDIAGGELPGFSRSYYPGAADASLAQFITVGTGDSIAGIDLWLPRGRTFRVTGRLVEASGAPSTGGSLHLVPSAHAGVLSSVAIGARIDPDGTFEFSDVPPGQYVVQADRGRKGRAWEGEFGSIPVVVVDRDVTGLTLQTSAGSTISGHIVIDSVSGNKPQSVTSLDITPVPADFDRAPNQPATADIREDGEVFIMQGVTGPRRIAVGNLPAGWALEAVRVDGADVTDQPIEFGQASQSPREVDIVLTDRVGLISGTVSNSRGRAPAGTPVVVFAADRDRWYFRSRYLAKVTTADDGSFTLSGLPSGTYYIAGVTRGGGGEGDSWQDPEWLESLSRNAEVVSIRDGEMTSVNLRLTAP